MNAKKNETDNNERIAFLKQKEREIRAKLAAEHVKQQKRKEKENARLFSIVGEALVENAAKNPDTLGLMVKQVLAASELRESDRAFLAGKGWC